MEKNKTKELEITHLTNDEYTYLINYITEKENQAISDFAEKIKEEYENAGMIGKYVLFNDIDRLKTKFKKKAGRIK